MTRILLVEDHDLNRYVLAKLFTKMGFTVLQAATGTESIEKAETEGVDIVLMDINLPDMKGWEVAAILKAKPSTKHIPIIGLSAHDEGSAFGQAMIKGCDDYDTKPVNMERLVQKIGKFIPDEAIPAGAHVYLAYT